MPEDTGTHQQPDPATVAPPPRADYDYSPLDLAPPGQRRKRQMVAAAIGAIVLALLIAAVVFATINLTGDDDDDGELAALRALSATATAQVSVAGTPDVEEDTGASEENVADTDSVVADESDIETDTDEEVVADPAEDAEAENDSALDQAGEEAAVDPTTAPAETTGSSGALSEAELEALLPSEGIMPQGLDMVESSSRTQQEVVGALGNNREAELNLEEWGWTANVERSFMASDPASLAPDATTTITVSLHGFANEQAAAEALVFYSDILLDLSYVETEVPQVGASSRMLELQQEDGGTTVAFYVQQGSVLYRIGGYSPGGDPTNNVVNAAQSMVSE